MNRITLNAVLPKDEKISVYVNGKLCKDTFFSAEGRFTLKIEQYRLSAEKGSALKNLISMLLMLTVRAGRMNLGKEISSPDRAVWEAECEPLADGDISVSLARNDDGKVLFDVSSDSVAFSNVKSDRISGKEEKRRWLGLLGPILIPVSVFLIAMIVLVWAGTADSEGDKGLIYIARTVFTVLPCVIIFILCSNTIRKYRSGGRLDMNKYVRKYRRIAVLHNTVAVIFAAVSLAEILLPLVWNFDMIVIAPLPCTVIAIIIFLMTSGNNEDVTVERGEMKEAAEKMRSATTRSAVAFAAVIAADIVIIVGLSVAE